MRRAIVCGLACALVACAETTTRSEPTLPDDDLAEVCTGTISDDVVRDVLLRAAEQAASAGALCSLPSYLFGRRMRVRADGRIDHVGYAGCHEQVMLFHQCQRESGLTAELRFPPLTTGDCAWIEVPQDLDETLRSASRR